MTWIERTDLLDSLLGFFDMFAIVRKRARRILELSLDFRKLIIKLVDQLRQSLYLSTFCQFLSVSSCLNQPVEPAHPFSPLLNLLDLTFHPLALFSSPLNFLFTFLDFPLRSCQVLLCLFGLVDGDSPLVSLDQAREPLQFRCCLLIFQITPLFCPELFKFRINLFLQ
jgi:hypothetical protein